MSVVHDCAVIRGIVTQGWLWYCVLLITLYLHANLITCQRGRPSLPLATLLALCSLRSGLLCQTHRLTAGRGSLLSLAQLQLTGRRLYYLGRTR